MGSCDRDNAPVESCTHPWICSPDNEGLCQLELGYTANCKNEKSIKENIKCTTDMGLVPAVVDDGAGGCTLQCVDSKFWLKLIKWCVFLVVLVLFIYFIYRLLRHHPVQSAQS